MPILDDRRREFVAKNVADLGKAIWAVAFASYFFERFPLVLRWGLPGLAIAFLVGSVFVHPQQKKG